MYSHHIEHSIDQPGKAANPALVVSGTEKINISLSPFAPENLVSRGVFGRPVPRHPAHSLLRLNLGCFERVSTYGLNV